MIVNQNRVKDEDVIIVSDDEDTIVISSDDSDDEVCVKTNGISQSNFGKDPKHDNIWNSTDSQDDPDLPDIPIELFDSRSPCPNSLAYKRNVLCEAESDKISPVPHCYYEPPVKVLKTDSESSLVNLIRKKMFNAMLYGGLTGQRSVCSMDLCSNIHSKEGEARPSKIQFYELIKTMMEDENLRRFGLRAMLHSINRRQYLSLPISHILLQYLIDGEERMEKVPPEDVYLGASILRKQLYFHPSCKAKMRHYYLQLSMKWVENILDKIEKVLESKEISSNDDSNLQDSGKPSVSEPVCNPFADDHLFDFSDVVQKKKLLEMERFKNQTKKEKLHVFCVLLEFFTDLMKSNVSVWLVRHWSSKSTPFRKDISPILAEIMWKDKNNLGNISQNVKKLFTLYEKCAHDKTLQVLCADLISLNACIIQRLDEGPYPEMGPKSRDFAFEFYQRIKSSSNITFHLKFIKPDWMKFQVISLLLDVVQPPNLFKMKETVLRHLLPGSANKFSYPFDVIKVCSEALDSMMNIMELKSSQPKFYNLLNRIIDDENVWFLESLNKTDIISDLKTIKEIFSILKENQRSMFYGIKFLVS